ncbi:ABC transporter ATP-binding protein [Streptomyces sp. NPDC020917]|uniref:ABC transporter ATP-binding protein n=1 Tax=Streptomyces sp. NPDC020917 TaxID=3365102 RepID=UPI0037A1D6DE
MADTGAAVRLSGLRKSYGATDALAGIDLDVRHGEFFSLLGPSGSGKTTTLRLIAGFEEPTGGSVELAGQDVTGLAPYERDVHTVFQDYALFPHMTVEQNVGYALKVRGTSRAERAGRVRDALALVRLEGHGRRRPAQLSGGQRQRVALARALIDRPAVLLLDEPLAALDLRLRGRMQAELKELQREVGITFVFVTHDQSEALSMSDRVAVFHAGRIEQVGTPAEVYERPATAFVADFVGASNLLSGEPARRVTGGPGPYSIRPERITLSAPAEDTGSGGAAHGAAGRTGASEHRASGTVTDVVYLGHAIRVLVDLDVGGRLTVLQHVGEPARDAAPGARVMLRWPAAHAVPLPADRIPGSHEDPGAHHGSPDPGAPATVPAPGRGPR